MARCASSASATQSCTDSRCSANGIHSRADHDVWSYCHHVRGAGRQASSPMWSLADPLGSATGRPSSHELQTATGRHVQSVQVACSPFCSHAGRRKTVLAVVMTYPSRFEKEPSIDPSTRTAPLLSTTATVDIKLLDSICGYDGALAAGSRGCLATRSGLQNAGRGDVFRARWSSPRGWARPLSGPTRLVTGQRVRRRPGRRCAGASGRLRGAALAASGGSKIEAGTADHGSFTDGEAGCGCPPQPGEGVAPRECRSGDVRGLHGTVTAVLALAAVSRPARDENRTGRCDAPRVGWSSPPGWARP